MSNASDYADSLHASILARVEADAPFGWINEYNGETASEDPRLDAEPDDDMSNWTEASAFDFIGQALDVEYVIGSDRKFKDGRVFVTVGGPTAWIDTEKRALIVTWMSEPVVRNLPSSYIDAVNDALAELWEMGA